MHQKERTLTVVTDRTSEFFLCLTEQKLQFRRFLNTRNDLRGGRLALRQIGKRLLFRLFRFCRPRLFFRLRHRRRNRLRIRFKDTVLLPECHVFAHVILAVSKRGGCLLCRRLLRSMTKHPQQRAQLLCACELHVFIHDDSRNAEQSAPKQRRIDPDQHGL